LDPRRWIKKKYPDVISEMWFNLAGHINEIGLVPNNELLEEVSSRHFKYRLTNDGRLRVRTSTRSALARSLQTLPTALILAFIPAAHIGNTSANVRAVAGI
jgi:hypothetical protein